MVVMNATSRLFAMAHIVIGYRDGGHSAHCLVVVRLLNGRLVSITALSYKPWFMMVYAPCIRQGQGDRQIPDSVCVGPLTDWPSG